jgi:hypothetical protein
MGSHPAKGPHHWWYTPVSLVTLSSQGSTPELISQLLLGRSSIFLVNSFHRDLELAQEAMPRRADPALLGGPVNDGLTLGKRQLNFSITGPPCSTYWYTVFKFLLYLCGIH